MVVVAVIEVAVVTAGVDEGCKSVLGILVSPLSMIPLLLHFGTPLGSREQVPPVASELIKVRRRKQC